MKDKCEECKGVMGHHSPGCSNITLESAVRQLNQYYKLYIDKYEKLEKQFENTVKGLQRKMTNSIKDTEFWKGKFYVVKHENNKLRAKLNKK